MRSKVFNTVFENMLRVLLLADTLDTPANVDRLAALDFICIYGKKCKVLDKNLHGDNEFGFAEFANKREKITEAIKLSVRNDFINVEHTEQGFLYSINDRGREIVQNIQSSYARAYTVGAKIVCRKFSGFTDDGVLQYISDRATESKEA
ncbi:ABC-three component system middle component 2 [Mobiluncus porci]|nr:ABC-three component system middle component 2 [Mobiluncus porci]